jgi:succinyl-diaminopimelate desuccinylase
MKNNQNLVSIPRGAMILGISRQHLLRLIKSQRVKGKKIGKNFYIPESEIAFLKEKNKEDRLKKQIERNFSDQVFFLQSLIQTKSANPFTPEKSDPQAPIELEVAKLIENKLQEFGLKPKRIALFPAERPNIVAKIKGQSGHRSLIFNGHMDTIMPASDYTFNPYSGLVKNGKIFGVGSADMKASLACFIFMAKALKDLKIKLRGDLILTFVIDEEPGASSEFGTNYLLNQGLKGSAAIVAEPRTDKIAIGCRGGYRFKITTFGQATHTGMEDWEKKRRGHNAVLDMAEIISALKDLSLPLILSPNFPGVKSVFTFPTIINGGTAINIVPERCEAYGDVRLLPKNTPRQIKNLILKKLKPLRKKINFKLEDIVIVPGVEIKANERIVRVLLKNAQNVLGKTPEIRGARPWDDSWMFIRRGIPTICGFGPDGDGIHGKDEYAELESIKKVTEIFTRTVIDYLGKK